MLYKIGTSLQILKVATTPTELDNTLKEVSSEEVSNSLSTDAVIEPKNSNFVYAWTRAVTADIANGNGDLFPLDELKKAYKTFIGRNLFLDHDTDSVAKTVGKVIGAKLMKDDVTGQIYVGCLIKVDKTTHPDIAAKVENGVIDSVSMGASVAQAKCAICGKVATKKDEFCKHMLALGRRDPVTGKTNVSINTGVTFTELSLVAVPADATAKMKKIFAEMNESQLEKVASIINEFAMEKIGSGKIGDYVFASEFSGYIDFDSLEEAKAAAASAFPGGIQFYPAVTEPNRVYFSVRSGGGNDAGVENARKDVIEHLQNAGITVHADRILDVKKKARSSETLKDVEKGVQEKSKEMLEILQPLLIQINKGLVVEREHTDDPAVAFKITMDHLKESLTYYDDLEKYVEKKPQVSTDKEKPSKKGDSMSDETKNSSSDINAAAQEALSKITALDLMQLHALFEKKPEFGMQAPKMDGKPEAPKAPEIKPEAPKIPEAPKMDGAKPTPGSKKWEEKDVQLLSKALKFLKEYQKREDLEGDTSKELGEVVNKLNVMLGEEKGEAAKAPEMKPGAPKAPEAPKPLGPVAPAKPPMKPMENKPFKPMASQIDALFLKDKVAENSRWLFIDKESKDVVLRARLKDLFGNVTEDRATYAATPEFANAIVANICEKGLTKEAIFEAVAKYSPCYPTENQMLAPKPGSHKHNTTKAPVEKDTEVSPLPSKQAEAAPEVTKVAEEAGKDLKKEDKPEDKKEDKPEDKKEASAASTVVKTAAASAATDASVANTEGSQVKEKSNHGQDESGHDKNSTKAPATTDAEVSPIPAKKAEVNTEMVKLAEENSALKTQIAAQKMQAALDKKLAKSRDLVEAMVQKGVFKVNEEYVKAEMSGGKTLEVAKTAAFAKSAEDLVKKCLQMDDTALEAFADSIKSIEKVATMDTSKVKNPIHIQASQSAPESYIDKSKKFPWD